MILNFVDQDGDDVAIESSCIVGVSVGVDTGTDTTVTLIWALGTGDRPFMVAAPFNDVLAAWGAARSAGPPPDLKGMHGWPLQYPHPSSVLPGAPAWAAKDGAK